MDSWANPNENVIRMRITEAGYAEEFIKYGRIKFNTPQSWVDYAKKHGEGRGDYYEGTLAFCNMYDITRLCELNCKYNSHNILSIHTRPLERNIYKERLLFKDERSMKLPCYCLYVLKVNAFSAPSGIGEQMLTTNIDGSYFRDFVDNQTVEQVKREPKDKQPALIVINDFGSFRSRLIKKLKSIGVSENDILVQYVAYFDFEKYGDTGWYDFQQPYPKELFIKSKRFEKQSEGRIVISTKDPKVLQCLENPIDLGCMEDIASIRKGYYPEGITIELKTTIFEKSDDHI